MISQGNLIVHNYGSAERGLKLKPLPSLPLTLKCLYDIYDSDIMTTNLKRLWARKLTYNSENDRRIIKPIREIYIWVVRVTLAFIFVDQQECSVFP